MTQPSVTSDITALILVIVLWPTMVALAGYAKATIGKTRPRTAEAVSTVLYLITCASTMAVGAWIGGAFA